jgi:sigma-E factor negative regulatory protein RseB
MRQKSVWVGAVTVVSGLLALAAYIRNANASSPDGDAQAWLGKIQTAAQRLDYSGIFVYQQANQVRTSRVTHMKRGQDEMEKLEVLDGKAREYIRTNDDVLYYVPETKTLLAERHVAQEVFPAILTAKPSELAEYYDIGKEGTERIAGFVCQIVTLQPKDNLRYGYRLWAEKSTGLLLRAQTLSGNGSAIEQVSFTQLKIGNIDRTALKPNVSDTKGWRVENAVASPAQLPEWRIKVPPGFRKIREVVRTVSDSTSANGEGASREISQIVFSDGLAAISVFIEPGTQSRTEGSLQQGALNVLGKRLGRFWITIVGEVPPAAVKQIADSVEFKSK